MKSKVEAIVCLTIIISMFISIFPTYAAVTDVNSVNKMLSLIDDQNFSDTTSKSNVKNYISHFTYNSKYAALYGKKFDYPNSGKMVGTISDGTYTISGINAKGCYAHSKFVSMVIYGKNGSRKYHTEKAKRLTGQGLKAFLLSEAQAGEHLRIDNKHSVVFISGDNNGFYYFSYNGDNYGKKILLVYKTYADFASKYNNVSSSEKSSIWLYNANPNTNTGNVNNGSNNTNNKTSTTPKPTNTSKPTKEASSVKISPNSYPSGNLKYGKDFTLTAKFTSDCAIVEARAYMLDSNKNVIQEAKGSSTTKNYYVEGYALDKGMKFNQLSPGGYYLRYYVKDANGDTATWTSNKFYVVKENSSSTNSTGNSSSSKKPASTSTPTPAPKTSIKFELESVPKGNLPYGKSFSLKGWFRSDCAIVEARAYILDSNKNVVMQSDKASSTTSNYKIQGYKLDKAMKFGELKPGGYYLKFFVRDANGDTATWISDKFYIVK